MQVAQEEKETLNGELQDLVKEKARLELNIKDMKKEVEDDSNARVCYRLVFRQLFCKLLFIIIEPEILTLNAKWL